METNQKYQYVYMDITGAGYFWEYIVFKLDKLTGKKIIYVYDKIELNIVFFSSRYEIRLPVMEILNCMFYRIDSEL